MGYSISVNEKLCKDALKAVNSALDNVKKYMGKSGDNSDSTIIGCVEKLNKGFRDTEEIAKLYDEFNASMAELAKILKEVDNGFQVIDKAV